MKAITITPQHRSVVYSFHPHNPFSEIEVALTLLFSKYLHVEGGGDSFFHGEQVFLVDVDACQGRWKSTISVYTDGLTFKEDIVVLRWLITLAIRVVFAGRVTGRISIVMWVCSLGFREGLRDGSTWFDFLYKYDLCIGMCQTTILQHMWQLWILWPSCR